MSPYEKQHIIYIIANTQFIYLIENVHNICEISIVKIIFYHLNMAFFSNLAYSNIIPCYIVVEIISYGGVTYDAIDRLVLL